MWKYKKTPKPNATKHKPFESNCLN